MYSHTDDKDIISKLGNIFLAGGFMVITTV